jgi:hypothetical protein
MINLYEVNDPISVAQRTALPLPMGLVHVTNL